MLTPEYIQERASEPVDIDRLFGGMPPGQTIPAQATLTEKLGECVAQYEAELAAQPKSQFNNRAGPEPGPIISDPKPPAPGGLS